MPLCNMCLTMHGRPSSASFALLRKLLLTMKKRLYGHDIGIDANN